MYYPMQRDAGGLTAENKELKLKLQALQQQAELREGISLSCYVLCLFSEEVLMLCGALIQLLMIH